MTYVNAALLVVREIDKTTYAEMASAMASLFREHGALQVFESWGSDIAEDDQASFAHTVKLEPDEGVVLSWIVWPSKTARDVGMKAVMSDPALMEMSTDRPFDPARMIHGGFETMVEL